MPNHSTCPPCPCCHARLASNTCGSTSKRAGGGLISWLFQAMLIYVGLVFTGGTLINTGHPVAVETGRLLHTVTLVEPAIHWTQSHGYGIATYGLQAIAGGMRFS